MSDSNKPLFGLLLLLVVTIADIWIACWFYSSYAKGTWMTFPTIASALIIPFSGFIILVISFPDGPQK